MKKQVLRNSSVNSGAYVLKLAVGLHMRNDDADTASFEASCRLSTMDGHGQGHDLILRILFARSCLGKVPLLVQQLPAVISNTLMQ